MYVPLFSVGFSLMVAAASGQAGSESSTDISSSVPSPSDTTTYSTTYTSTYTYPPSSTYSSDSTGSDTTISAVEGFPDCLVDRPEYIGDGVCDDQFPVYNTEVCGFDGGDCCECDCKETDYPCGWYHPYNCVDPSSKCPSVCSNGIDGFEGSNDSGSACCPLGCNQCGSSGCGESGAGQGLDYTNCCVQGVLNTQEFCSVTGEAPCQIDVPRCIEGIDGYLGENSFALVCCPVGCTQCGGTGCGTVGAASGLGSSDCCVNGIVEKQELCSVSGEAPCVL